MHFFTETTKLDDQAATGPFGPLSTDSANVFNVSSQHAVTSKAKLFACQDAMMLVQPHVVGGSNSSTLVNIVLKPIEGLDIKLSPVKYYVYRGVEKKSLITGTNTIVARGSTDETEFSKNLWANWDKYVVDLGLTGSAAADPTAESFGYKDDLSNATNKVHLIEEYFNSADSTNTTIKDFQAIKVTEGQWIGNIPTGTNFEFEIIMDTDHLTMDLNYFQQPKQTIDATGLVYPNLNGIAEREKVLNYIDPAAFFGMHYYVGVDIASYTGATKNPPILKKEEDLFNDILILNKFLNRDVVYLDIRSERGYSYYYYKNYKKDVFVSSTLSHTEVLQLKSKSQGAFNYLGYLGFDWPLINLKNPPSPLSGIVNGDKIELKLLIQDNENPILFAENPKLFGSKNTDVFLKGEALWDTTLDPAPDYTDTVTLEVPFVDVSGTKTNVSHHIKLQYFRSLDSTSSPNTVFKASQYLNAAFGGVKIPELDITTAFQHVHNNKRTFISSTDFSYVGENGVYQDDNLALFYSDNAYSLKKSGNVYPRIDIEKTSFNSVMDNALFKNDKIFKKWQIKEGVTDIDIIEIVGYNKLKPSVPVEDILFVGLTKAELTTLNGISGVSDLHHKYFVFEEVFNGDGSDLVDAVTSTKYRKFEIKLQGLDSSGVVQIVPSGTSSGVYVYGTSLYMLCSKDFAAATVLPNLIPDPGTYTEFDHVYRYDYDGNDAIVSPLFKGGHLTVPDSKYTPTVSAGLIGEIFYPVDSHGSDVISTRKTDYPLAVIVHGNGHRYSSYRELGTHLAKNGFIVSSISGLYDNENNFVVQPVTSIAETFSVSYTSDYYIIGASSGSIDTIYIYYNNSTVSPINANYAYGKITALQYIESGGHYTVTNEHLLSWENDVDFHLYLTPFAKTWERKGGADGIGLNEFGLAWESNSGSTGSFVADITKDGATKIVDLTLANWSLSSYSSIRSAINAGSDIVSTTIPFVHTYPVGSEKYLGVINNGIYYMLKINSSSAGPCSTGTGTCVTINLEVKNSQIQYDFKIGEHDLGILGRSNLIFPHLQILKKFLGNRVQNNISLIGHSRGAESIVRCVEDIDITKAEPITGVVPYIRRINMSMAKPWVAGVDKWQHVPNDLDNITAVISLAPTDQCADKPDGVQIESDIPYFVLYGSMEGDVIGAPGSGTRNRTSGFSIYDRSVNKSEKSMAFVYGATHNGFVTNNHDYIDFVGSIYVSNTHLDQLIDTATQRKITLGYMNAFLRLHVKGEDIWRDIFTGDYIPTAIMHDEIYMQYKNMQTGEFKKVLDFESSGIGTGVGKVSLNADIADLSEGQLRSLDGKTPHDTKGLKVEWNEGDYLTFKIKPVDKDVSSFEFLSFRVSQVVDTSSSPSYDSIDNIIIHLVDSTPTPVHDGGLNKSIPNPHHRESTFYTFGDLTKSSMITVRIPLADFAANNVDLTDIVEVKITFPPGSGSGEILIDDVEFTN